MFVREYVKKLDEETLLQIIKDKEEFDKKGFIEECILRDNAKIIIEQIGDREDNVVYWMDLLATEAYRYFAYKYLHNEAIRKLVEE